MRNQQASLRNKELYQLKWLVGTLLSLLAFWSLWSLDMQGELYIIAACIVVLVFLVKPQLVESIPSKIWRPAGVVILVVIIGDFILNLPEFMPPLLRMVILLMVYRTLAPRRRRDDLQMVLLCLFCLVISGALTVSLLFAFQILLFTPLAMCMMFLVCILDRGVASSVPTDCWQTFRFSRLLSRVLHVLNYRVLALGAILFGFVVAVSTMLFVLTPRFDLNRAIPYLELRTETRAGFSENVKLGEVSDIQSDNSVALRIDVPSLDSIPQLPYWRMLTLDEYDQGHFRMSDVLKGRLYRKYLKTRELMGRDLRGLDAPFSRESVDRWTIYMEGGMSQYLPIPGAFHSIRLEGEQDLTLMPGMHHVGLDSVRQRVFSYQIEDLQWTHRFPALEIEAEAFSIRPNQLDSTEVVTYPLTTLELSVSEAERAFLNELNEEILGSMEPKDVATYSEQVVRYFAKSYSYSLSPSKSADGGDAVVNWLRRRQGGHCEYFAGGFILLAREAGYPARMVVGFTGGAWNMVEDYYVVRNDNAHAWVEIYDAAAEEWLRVDPTPGNDSANSDLIVSSSQNLEEGWSAWTDSLRIQWYRRVVNFDQRDQIDMAITMKDVWDDFAEKFSEKASAVGARLSAWLKEPFSGDGILRIAIAVSMLITVWGLWHARYHCIGLLYRLLRRPKALDPLRVEAGRYLRKCKRKGIDGVVRSELEAIRFGLPSQRAEAKAVFKRARKALKK
ncbi:MAG: transglutaminaseTgpA domain-containing protein [Opitutaceae bacterium]